MDLLVGAEHELEAGLPEDVLHGLLAQGVVERHHDHREGVGRLLGDDPLGSVARVDAHRIFLFLFLDALATKSESW